MTATPGPQTIGSRLARIARGLPDKIALVDQDAEVSYRELDAAATAIARGILAAGADRSGVVCLLFASKIPAIAAIFGAGRSGHTYVPLDAADPEERLRFILGDSEPVALLTEAPLLERARGLAPAGCTVLDVGHLDPGEEDRTLPEVAADALVYLFYTSGSTGQPKGVGQTHANLLFFVDAYARTLCIDEADRVSLLYTLSFSAANMDIFGALSCGATLCGYDLRRDGIRHLAGWLDRERITVLHSVPTVFRELAGNLAPGRRLPHLKAIDLGGEAVFGSDVESFREHTPENCILVNHLAATEASVVAQQVIGHGGGWQPGAMIPVGRCPEGVRVQIRRDDGSEAARNEVGELIVCSPHVSPGYWRRPELNAAAFSADPQVPGFRRYRSGDYGHIDDEGRLHFLGRRDSRIKLRGHSVDLMEVEAALAACPGVTKAAVVAVGERDTERHRLVAYLTPAEDGDRDPLPIRQRIATCLPSYMWPSGFVFVAALPLTASGKIDRNALALLPPPEADPLRPIEPARDDVERAVAGIFGDLLHVVPIGRDDDFFLLGGDSLAAVELQARLRDRFGVNVTSFHDLATVAAIAAAIRDWGEARSSAPRAMPVLVPLWRQGTAPPLFLVHGRHGQAFVSPHFMRLLGNDQPVWVFQARGLDGLREPHATIAEMAAEYLAELRTVRAHGPYFIGALCAGALIAGEIARALARAGESVLPLLLLDPPNRAWQGGGYLQLTEERFVGKMRKRAAMGGIAAPVNDPSYMKAVVKTVTAFEHAIANHRPQPYGGPVYMLSSSQRLAGPNRTYLESIFTGDVRRFEVAPTHKQVLDPHNTEFAGCLARCLGLIRGAVKTDPMPRSALHVD